MLPNTFPRKDSEEGAPVLQLLMGEGQDQHGPQSTCMSPRQEEGGMSPEDTNDTSRSYTLMRRDDKPAEYPLLGHLDKHSRGQSCPAPCLQADLFQFTPDRMGLYISEAGNFSFQWQTTPVFNSPPPVKHFPSGISNVWARRELGNHIDKASRFRKGRIRGSPFLEKSLHPIVQTRLA